MGVVIYSQENSKLAFDSISSTDHQIIVGFPIGSGQNSLSANCFWDDVNDMIILDPTVVATGGPNNWPNTTPPASLNELTPNLNFGGIIVRKDGRFDEELNQPYDVYIWKALEIKYYAQVPPLNEEDYPQHILYMDDQGVTHEAIQHPGGMIEY